MICYNVNKVNATKKHTRNPLRLPEEEAEAKAALMKN